MPGPLSEIDRKRYGQLASLLHSLTYSLTNRFMNDEKSRGEILDQLKEHSSKLVEQYAGCPDDLCYDKEQGCIPCTPSQYAARKL